MVPGGGFGAGADADIMSDSGAKTPRRPPITPPARQKAPFSGFRSPKYALLTPLFSPKPPKNHPFSAHFRAPAFGHIARVCPAVAPAFRLAPVATVSHRRIVAAGLSCHLLYARARQAPTLASLGERVSRLSGRVRGSRPARARPTSAGLQPSAFSSQHSAVSIQPSANGSMTQ